MVTAGPDRADARAMLAFIGIATVFVTLYPLRFVDSAEEFRHGLSYLWRRPFDSMTPVHTVPAACMAYLASRGWGGRVRAGAAVLTGLALLEVAQASIEQRHARGGDLAAQALGVAAGAAVAGLRIPGAAWRWAWRGLAVALTLSAGAVGVTGQLGHRIGPVDESFRLVIGDEHDGERLWTGEIRFTGVYAAPCDDATAAALAQHPLTSGHGLELRRSLGPCVLHDFSRRTSDRGDRARVDDLGTLGVPVFVRGSGSASPLDTASEGAATSRTPAAALSRAIQQAGAVIVEADVTPGLDDQRGPARIVTLSKGLAWRNVTIGQEGDALDVRVRTQRSGPNAARFQSRFPGLFRVGRPVHLVVASNGGSVWVWADGLSVGSRHHRSGPGDWLFLRPEWRDLAASGFLFVPIGLASAQSVRTRFIAASALALMLAGSAIGAAWGVALAEGRPVRPLTLVLALGCAALGVVGARLLSRRHSCPDPPDVLEQSGRHDDNDDGRTPEPPCPPQSPTDR